MGKSQFFQISRLEYENSFFLLFVVRYNVICSTLFLKCVSDEARLLSLKLTDVYKECLYRYENKRTGTSTLTQNYSVTEICGCRTRWQLRMMSCQVTVDLAEADLHVPEAYLNYLIMIQDWAAIMG
ncbi:hypothetical protein GWI33_011610, partial [Rhynchophorus ferrugineus]